MGITAGSGSEGAGDAERRIDGDEPNDDRRLWLITLGGFIGKVSVVGVPGADGPGEPIAIAESMDVCERKVRSGGAGL
jgi:hypothetical protein